MNELLTKYSQVFIPGAMGAEAPKVFAKRRQQHLRELDKILVLSGVDREPGAENIWMMNSLRVYQEPSVLWLSGINQCGVRLVLNPFRKGKDRYLVFVPSKSPEKEFWDGVRFGVVAEENSLYKKLSKEAEKLLGTKRIYKTEDFFKVLAEEMKEANQNDLYAFYHEYDSPKDAKKKLVIKTDHNFKFVKDLKLKLKKLVGKNTTVQPWADQHYRLRLPLDTWQVEDVYKAQEITNESFKALLPKMKKLRNENEIAAELEYGFKKKTPFGLAFPSIIAAGKNACTLHYLKNDEPIENGQLVLMDFGARWATQHADISRTIPTSGKFNPLQKLLYEIVLGAQSYNEEYMKPGVLLKEANARLWVFIEEELEKKFFSKGGKAKRAYTKAPHGVSHLMGEQEHDGDPFRLYSSRPLKKGMMISNEPGLYGYFEIEINKTLYKEWIGIRIEDDLIVTSDGCENVSQGVPKTVKEIEKLMNSKEKYV